MLDTSKGDDEGINDGEDLGGTDDDMMLVEYQEEAKKVLNCWGGLLKKKGWMECVPSGNWSSVLPFHLFSLGEIT